MVPSAGPLLKADVAKLEQFHLRCIRLILSITRQQQWDTRLSSGELRQHWGAPDSVADMICCRRLEWLGHIMGMPDTRLLNAVFFAWFPITGPVGVARKRWKDMICHDIHSLHLPNWPQLYLLRHEWYAAYSASLAARQEAAQMPARDVVCEVCHQKFHHVSDMSCHKCVLGRQLPVHEQPGVRHCQCCLAKSGGFVVHRCAPTAAVPPARVAIPADCCHFHCSVCGRCMKSASGFKRHKCRH